MIATILAWIGGAAVVAALVVGGLALLVRNMKPGDVP